jgi:hypothetical protein
MIEFAAVKQSGFYRDCHKTFGSGKVFLQQLLEDPGLFFANARKAMGACPRP